MPVVLTMKSSNVGNPNGEFFKAVLSPKRFAEYESLVGFGVKFDLSFYSVSADLSAYHTPIKAVTLPASTTSILKKSVLPGVMTVVRDLVDSLISSVLFTVNAVQASPSFKQPAEPVPTTSDKVFKTPKKMLVDGMAAVPLSQADTLLQPVKGTSVASTYQAVALSERVKVAVRYKTSGTLSVRVEGAPTEAEQAKLASIGLTKGGGAYWSIHFDIGEVPLSRCLGAFLLGLEIPFDEIVTDTTGVKAVKAV